MIIFFAKKLKNLLTSVFYVIIIIEVDRGNKT